MNTVEVQPGDSPIVLGLPHTGTYVPPEIFARLNQRGQLLADTDWHIHQLYEGLLPGATTVRATFHRYVIDANRDPVGDTLYPGQNTTTLVPQTDFDGESIWLEPPTEEDVAARLEEFHQPYHRALREQLDRVHARHGVAILYDCHSIRSQIPFLFDGVLPDFNVGTNNSTTCAAEIEAAVVEVCERANDYSSTVNGRFRGGWTTRHYGSPEKNTHAIQMELAQSTYLETESPPFQYSATKAAQLRRHLKQVLESLNYLATHELSMGTNL